LIVLALVLDPGDLMLVAIVVLRRLKGGSPDA
jgi:hypothetical protein